MDENYGCEFEYILSQCKVRSCRSCSAKPREHGLHKPRSHTIVATAILGAILDRHADHMRHKTRVLPSREKVVAKVLPSNFN